MTLVRYMFFVVLSAALEVTQRILENKDDWSSLFKSSDFFQKYKFVNFVSCSLACLRYFWPSVFLL